ncbi:MAG: transcriptional repressor [Gammaproteobacteria bacterium]|nr:transcriptional repressor [Gammaproteobacteria bacterium]
MMPNETIALIEKKLREHGVKATARRIEIGALLLSAPCHMSADQILNCLREAGSRVSKATVYNTLHLFSRKGIVRELAVDPGHLVYDSTTAFHHHFFNADSGELIDIDPDGLEIKGLPELPPDTRAESVELIIRVRNKR